MHTKNDSSKINYGLSLGVSLHTDNIPNYFSTIVLSKRMGIYVPYFAFTYHTDFNKIVFGPEYSLGSEIQIYRYIENNLSIILTPEIIYFPYNKDDEIFPTPLGGSIAIGITFDFIRFFN